MLTVRAMQSLELSLAVQWAAREGWNPGVDDAALFGAVDPAGFFVAEIDGEPVGSISAVCYDDGFAFVGFFIVEPEHRGKGVGRALWRAAMDHAGDRNVGLDGVPAQIANYERSGFRIDYRTVRYRGRGGGRGERATRSIDSDIADAVVAYDRGCFPAPRARFIRDWISQPNAAARCLVEGGRVRGYGVIRCCVQGWKIGPLFADDALAAQSIFNDLRAGANKTDDVYLDVPSIHAAAVDLARSANMEPVFETARMYTAGRPLFSLERCFGITSFELG